MKIPHQTEAEAKRVSTPRKATGWRLVEITDATEEEDKNGASMLALTFAMPDAEGVALRDWIWAHDRGGLKRRHAAEAVGALAKWETTGELSPEDFIGRQVQVKIVLDKRRGWLNVEDYRAATAASARPANLRAVS